MENNFNFGHNPGIPFMYGHFQHQFNGVPPNPPPNNLIANPEDANGTHLDQDMSDCESVNSDPRSEPSAEIDRGLQRLFAGDKTFNLVTSKFRYGLGSLRDHIEISAVHKNAYSDRKVRGIWQDFNVWVGRMERKCGGNLGSANVQDAWCAVSKEEMFKIVQYGFMDGFPKNDGSYGQGIYLTPRASLLECLKNAVVDEDGLQHVLLCRAILGNVEIIEPGSQQDCPSKPEYDSGVDNLPTPTKYIIWSFFANSHVLPEFVISFRAPSSLDGLPAAQVNETRGAAPKVPITAVIPRLAEFLQPSDITLLNNYYKEFMENKISRHYMVNRMKELAGGGLLVSVVKSVSAKKLENPRE